MIISILWTDFLGWQVPFKLDSYMKRMVPSLVAHSGYGTVYCFRGEYMYHWNLVCGIRYIEPCLSEANGWTPVLWRYTEFWMVKLHDNKYSLNGFFGVGRQIWYCPPLSNVSGWIHVPLQSPYCIRDVEPVEMIFLCCESYGSMPNPTRCVTK